jgi:hypothetical protein
MIPAAEWIRAIRKQHGLDPSDPWVTIYAAEVEMIQKDAFAAGKKAAREKEAK